MKRALLIGAMSLTLAPGYGVAEIGSVAAVNRDMDGTPPAGVRRPLSLGNTIVRDELVQTSPIGSGQLMFLDQTTLTVAPNSDIVLDTYVYDPDQQSGEIAISLTKGALRFIGGRISKTNDAVINTPTATIGIRGGLTIIQVAEDGSTIVTQVAGEYAEVRGKGAGGKVTLSRPNSSASAGQNTPAVFTGIVGSETLAEIYGVFEGSGDGGSSTLEDLNSTGTSSENQQTAASSDGSNTGSGASTAARRSTTQEQSESGDGQSGDGTTTTDAPQPTVGERLDTGLAGVSELNSDVPGGELEQPISTSGERPAVAGPEVELAAVFADSPQTEDNPANDPLLAAIEGDIQTDQVPDTSTNQAPPPPPPEPPVVLSGSAITDPTGFIAFDNIFNGSLVGEGFPSGSNIRETVTIEIPETSADFLQTLPNGDPFFLFANELTSNAGLFAFGDGTNIPRGSTTSIGPVDGFGFSDIDQDFHFYILNGDPDPTLGFSQGGAVLFGVPTLGQASVADVDVSGALPSSNTIGTFIIDNDLTELADTFFGFSDSSPDGDLFRLNVVGNALEARFPNPTHSLESNGGRVFGGELTIVEDQPGNQFTDFFVIAGPLFQTGDSLRFSVEGFGSTGEQFGAGVPQSVLVRDEPFGTFEDANQNTVFGVDANYLVISSLLREDPAAPLTLGSGIEREVGGTFSEVLDPFAAVATRDPLAERLIQDPFPLALGPATALGAAIDAGLQVPTAPFLSGFAAGHAQCPSGLCGFSPNQTGQNNSFYRLGGEAFFSFENGDVSGSGLGQNVDSNTLTAIFEVFGDESENISGQVDSEFTFAAVGTATAETAYADEKTFVAIARSDNQGSIGTAGGIDISDGTFAVASTAVTGDGGLFPDTNIAQSEFLVWGPWSAVFETQRVNGPEEDVVNLGFFVAGADPDASQFPTTGIAVYDGFAVGTRGDLVTGAQTYVAGESSLVYNFGQNVGSFSINIAEFDVAGATAEGLGVGVNGYTVSNFSNGVDLNAQGRFFAGGTNPVAATAGDFGITDNINNVAVTGVFGADANGPPTQP